MAEETQEIPPAVIALGGDGRRRGRPRVTPGESSRISVRIWSEHHDALIQKARARGISVESYIRSVLAVAARR